MRTPKEIRDIFTPFEARLSSCAISDYGGLNMSAATFCEIAPRTGAELAEAVKLACTTGVPVRTRGRGHTMNGSALPSSHELLIRTERLCDVRFEAEGKVRAGSGIALWALRSYVNRFGYDLPTVNDGYNAPSLGGFVAAGGFGPGCERYGGFWENVASLTVVNGRGEIRCIRRDDELFPWFFGGMGQLGIVIDAELDITPLEPGAAPPYPTGAGASTEEIAASPELHAAGPPEEERGKHLFWFTLFVPAERVADAHAQLSAIEAKYQDVLIYRPRYDYSIVHRAVVATLVYPRAESFVATGAWAILDGLPAEGVRAVRAFEADFAALTARCGYRRYIQTELPAGAEAYRSYFGEEIYESFRLRKTREDPAAIINRGWVFPA